MATVKKPRKKKKRKGHYITGSYTSTRSGQVCKYRSGWELKYMEHLDVNPDVISWSYESFTIEYVSNKKTGRVRKYIPDFRVEYVDKIVIVEIKPSRRLGQPTVKKKMEAAERWCGEHGVALKVITEFELKLLGLLLFDFTGVTQGPQLVHEHHLGSRRVHQLYRRLCGRFFCDTG